jgi:hypothetical protein
MPSAMLADKEELEKRWLRLVLRDRGVFTILLAMKQLRTFVAESVSPKDFYHRQWEGRVVEEIVRLLDGKTSYRIVMNASLLRGAIKSASTNSYNIFHLSCHGSKRGVRLSDKTRISWEELADYFQKADLMPSALVLSSCVGGDSGIARAFEERKRRPQVIFGAEATEEKHLLTFPGACISWPILYTVLATRGMTPPAFKDAVNKMNHITSHRFVYRRLEGEKYRRYPSQE